MIQETQGNSDEWINQRFLFGITEGRLRLEWDANPAFRHSIILVNIVVRENQHTHVASQLDAKMNITPIFISDKEQCNEECQLSLIQWGKTRTKIPDGGGTQVGPFPCTRAM